MNIRNSMCIAVWCGLFLGSIWTSYGQTSPLNTPDGYWDGLANIMNWQGDTSAIDSDPMEWKLLSDASSLTEVSFPWSSKFLGLLFNFTLDFPPSNQNFIEWGWQWGTDSVLTFRIGESGHQDGLKLTWQTVEHQVEWRGFDSAFGHEVDNAYFEILSTPEGLRIKWNERTWAVDWQGNRISHADSFFLRMGSTKTRKEHFYVHRLYAVESKITTILNQEIRQPIFITEFFFSGQKGYLEAYNASDQSVFSWQNELHYTNGFIKLPPLRLAPYQYGVYLENSFTLSDNDITPWVIFYSETELKFEPAWLFSGDQVIQYLPFQKFSFAKTPLEMVSIFQPCLIDHNWQESKQRKGSPGKENSVFSTDVQYASPQISWIASNKVLISHPFWIIDTTWWYQVLDIPYPYRFAGLPWLTNEILITLEDGYTFQNDDFIHLMGEWLSCGGETYAWNASSQYQTGRLPDQQDVLISEIMFDPVKGCPEYVEIYNSTNDDVNVEGLELWGNQYQLDLSDIGKLKPNQVIVLTNDRSQFNRCYEAADMNKVIEIELFPLRNLGMTLGIRNNLNQNIDQIAYVPDDVHPYWIETSGMALERKLTHLTHPEWKMGYEKYGFHSATFIPLENKRTYEPKVLFSSRVISPNGDGFQDELEILFGENFDLSYTTIIIYDVNGQKIDILANHKPIQSGDVILWRGKNHAYQKLPAGLYLFWVYVFGEYSGTYILKETCALSQ